MIFVFAPECVKYYEEIIILHFDDDFTEDILLRVSANGIDVPIYVEKPVYDLKVCTIGNSFQERLMFYNRGSAAMKIEVFLPPKVKDILGFHPNVCFIQAKDSFPI